MRTEIVGLRIELTREPFLPYIDCAVSYRATFGLLRYSSYNSW